MTTIYIVARLRSYSSTHWPSLYHDTQDAADEIERLRAEVDSKDAQAYRHLRRLYDERGEDIAKLEDEIRELGNALTSMSKSRDRAMRALEEAVRGD